MPPKGYKKKTYTKKSKPKSKPKSTMKAMIKKEVKKEVSKDIEDKYAISTFASFGFYQQGTSTIISTYALNLIPSIPNNITIAGRIGLALNVKKFILRGFLRLGSIGLSGETPYTPGQFHVRIFIGRLKLSNNTPQTTDYDELLRSGSITQGFNSFSGLSLCRRINTEKWSIFYDKIHKIGLSQPSNNSTTFNTLSGLANNDYKLNKLITIDMTKFIKNKFIFNDSTSTFPTNTGLYVFGGVVDSLASDVSLSNAPVLMDFEAVMSYEDA